MDIYKELGLDNPNDGAAAVPSKIVLKDPITGNPATFNTQEEADAAVQNLYRNLEAKIKDAEAKLAEATAKPVKKEKKENEFGLTSEEEATFEAISKDNPLKGLQYIVARNPEIKALKEELAAAKEREQALVSSLQVNTFVSSTPELNNKVNPKAAEAQSAVVEALKAIGVEKNPTQGQLAAATALAKQYRPDLFQTAQNQGGQEVTQNYQGETRTPQAFVAPPRVGSGNFGATNGPQLLADARRQGPEKMEEVFRKMVDQFGIDALA